MDPMQVTDDRRALVSVVIPVFNGEKYLADTMDSIFRQTYQCLEVIVVDDGSTDGTAAIAKRYERAKYVYQARGGVGTALNAGFSASTGEYLAGLDADDLWTPDKIELQLQAFFDKPELDIVFGYVEQFISAELDEVSREKILCPVGAQPGPSICTILVRRESFLEVGWFSVELAVGQFIDWYLRATELKMKIEMLPQTIMHRRLHKSNLSQVSQTSSSQYLKILKQSLDRRRASGASANAKP